MSNYQRSAYVVFTGKTNLWYLKLLKRGFRHCFLILEDKNYWISFDPLLSHTEIEVIPKNPNIFLPDWLKTEGYEVIKARFNKNSHKRAPIALLNCVENIKRVLGIHNFMIMTPNKLFKHLEKNNKEN